MSVKLPPVELDSVTITLVAFTWRESVREPAAIVKFVAGELSEIVSAVLYVSGEESEHQVGMRAERLGVLLQSIKARQVYLLLDRESLLGSRMIDAEPLSGRL